MHHWQNLVMATILALTLKIRKRKKMKKKLVIFSARKVGQRSKDLCFERQSIILAHSSHKSFCQAGYHKRKGIGSNISHGNNGFSFFFFFIFSLQLKFVIWKHSDLYLKRNTGKTFCRYKEQYLF